MASELSPLQRARFDAIRWRLDLPFETYGIPSAQPDFAIIGWLKNNAGFPKMNKKNGRFLWPLRSDKPKPYIPTPAKESSEPAPDPNDPCFTLPKRSFAQRLIPFDDSASVQPREMIWVPMNATQQEEEQIRAIYRRYQMPQTPIKSSEEPVPIYYIFNYL